jgi:uncharacterized membrane protein YagU involved in acid resistance
MKIKIEKSSYWFLITALCNLFYSPIVHFFLKNPNLGERFKGMSLTFYVSYLYVAIGLIWLVFGALYIISDNAQYFKFTQKSKQLHFFLTITFIFCLMLVPILDTYYPTSDANRNSWFSEIFGYILPVAVLAFFGGIGLYIINLLKAVFSLIAKK